MSGLGPTAEFLSFARPKERNQRQICWEQIWTPVAHEVRAPGWRESAGRPAYRLNPALLAFVEGFPKGLPSPYVKRAASLPRPFGQFSTKAAMLGAV